MKLKPFKAGNWFVQYNGKTYEFPTDREAWEWIYELEREE